MNPKKIRTLAVAGRATARVDRAAVVGRGCAAFIPVQESDAHRQDDLRQKEGRDQESYDHAPIEQESGDHGGTLCPLVPLLPGKGPQ